LPFVVLNCYSNSCCLFSSGLVHTAAPPRLITTIEVKVGEKVTFNCSLTEDESRFVQWYKQSPGKIIETVASGAYSNVKLLKPFNNQRLQVNNSKDQMFLTITSVTKEDEAEYFCQGGGEYLQVFKAGFLLTVKDCQEQPAVYVRQSPGLAAAQLGESVNFQCLMISKNEENIITCPGNQNVHWFRSASGSPHPGVIFTPTDLNNQTVGKSCVYRLTKTLNDSSYAGSYYCAVAMCGEILFGNGTRVEMKYSGRQSCNWLSIRITWAMKRCSFSSSDRPSRKASATSLPGLVCWNTWVKASRKAGSEGQETAPRCHSAVAQAPALSVRWEMMNATLARSVG
uniref:Ig-like domain-containing protein n=1 Tax=Oryzias latipes TaxID=8090 RepID=A0A3B3HN70_ORYLA